MSTATATAPASISQPVTHKDDLREKHAHAGVAMAIATLAMGATSGIQALLYLSSFGVNARTDGFFVAFALYTSFGVFSQSIRVTSAPMLVGGERARLSPREFALALAVVAIPVALATIPLAGPLAGLLAPGVGAAGQDIAETALPILGAAMILQLWAAGGATVLAVRDRFDRIAFAYIAGAVSGLVVYLAVSGPAGELSLGWSMLAMAVVTSVAMLDGVRASGGGGTATRRRLDLRRIARAVGLVLGSTLIYLAFNGLYVITLAFASKYGAGGATVLSYAYLFASYLVAATGFALGMSRIADMRRGALADWREVIADTVPAGFRYAMLIVAPALAALIAGGATLIGEVLPSSFDPAQVHQLKVFGALLAAWTVAALLVNLLLPALFALGRAKVVNVLAPVLVVLHVAVTALGGTLWGVNGVVGAFFVVPTAFAVALLLIGAGQGSAQIARELLRDGLRFVLAAAACFGIGAAVGASVATGLVAPLLTIAIGSLLYALLTPWLAPTQVRLLLGAVRPASA